MKNCEGVEAFVSIKYQFLRYVSQETTKIELLVLKYYFSNVKSENDISITQFRDESRRLHHM
jgi:hypothetical protein